ncbi:MAG TPA: hypothetical protein VG839_01330 [Asticcacaulis sp.]|nr:hypothetical protein [Asticcacaulis sp.]
MKLSAAKGLALSLFALSLASCATDTPPPPPPPPPAPAGPPVALAPEISDAASVYVAYIEQARALRADFADGQTVQVELQTGASYEPTQLARGAVAYGAIVAMQEPAFRSALRAYASDNAARADLVNRLLSDPNYAASLPSANVAARRVILAISTDGQSVYKAGARVKQAAYDVQHQSWSKEFVPGRDERLALAKQNSVTLKSVQSDQSAKLLAAALTGQGLVTRARTGEASGDAAIGGAPSVADQSANPAAAEAPLMPAANTEPPVDFGRADLFDPPYTNAVNRSLTIAAVAILGEGGPTAHADSLIALMDEADGQRCFSMSKLNLYQCLAVAKPYYEDVFCLGQHVLMDTGQCLGKMSSNALSLEPPHKMMGINADGTTSATAVAYLQPAKPVKCKKGKKCPTAAKTTTASTTKTSSTTTSSDKKPATKAAPAPASKKKKP